MRILMSASIIVVAAATAFGSETTDGKKVVVEEKTVLCTGDGKAPPSCKVMQGGSGQTTVDVEVTQSGKKIDKKVIVIRRPLLDDADSDKDGMVSRAEFLAHAEKHFAEMDRDKSGTLSREEAMPDMPSVMMLEDKVQHDHQSSSK